MCVCVCCVALGQPVVLLAALPVLRRLLRHQGAHFGDFVELVVARLLDCTRSADREVMHASERTLDLLVSVVQPSRTLQVSTVLRGVSVERRADALWLC